MAQYIYTMIGVSKIVPPNRTIIKNISLSFFPGAKIGSLGLNGAGKSTLFRMLTGQEKPDSGEIIFGSTVKLSSVDQSRDSLDGDKTVWEEIADGQRSKGVRFENLTPALRELSEAACTSPTQMEFQNHLIKA